MLIQANISQDSTGGNRASELGERGRGDTQLVGHFGWFPPPLIESLVSVSPGAEQQVRGGQREEDAEEPVEKTRGAQQWHQQR